MCCCFWKISIHSTYRQCVLAAKLFEKCEPFLKLWWSMTDKQLSCLMGATARGVIYFCACQLATRGLCHLQQSLMMLSLASFTTTGLVRLHLCYCFVFITYWRNQLILDWVAPHPSPRHISHFESLMTMWLHCCTSNRINSQQVCLLACSLIPNSPESACIETSTITALNRALCVRKECGIFFIYAGQLGDPSELWIISPM